jgi:hypothetical protein
MIDTNSYNSNTKSYNSNDVPMTGEDSKSPSFGGKLLDNLWLLIVDVIIIQSTTNLVQDQLGVTQQHSLKGQHNNPPAFGGTPTQQFTSMRW